jgi:hypothetical protein
MPALVAGIHVSVKVENEDVDSRVKPGHDDPDKPSTFRFKISAGIHRLVSRRLPRCLIAACATSAKRCSSQGKVTSSLT